MSEYRVYGKLYTAMHGEPSARAGTVWVRSDQGDGKVAVLLSSETIDALRGAMCVQMDGMRPTLHDSGVVRLLALDCADMLGKK
jgi:hypothetical protein